MCSRCASLTRTRAPHPHSTSQSRSSAPRSLIIWKNDDVYSTGIHDKFVAEAKTKGLQVVSDNTFTDASANDFSVQLNDAKSKGADLVFLPMYYQPASLILTQANSNGLRSRSSSA